MSNTVELRSPRFAARGVRAFLALACVSCISDTPSAEPDVRDTAETFFVETTTDATPLDTAETGVTTPETTAEVIEESGQPEVVVQSCTRAEDCETPPPECSTWVCPAGFCEAAPASGASCDDKNLCTGAGLCQSGVCQSGKALTCDGATACGRPTCDPLTGCGLEPIDGGVCEAGNGTPWGACNGVRMAPVDLCDDGACIDQSTPANVPVPTSLVEGPWFVAAMWVHPTFANIMAGVATFDAGGKWGATFRTNNGEFTLDDDLTTRRSWCLDANNGLSAQVSSNDFTGQMDASGRVFTATGAIADDVMVGLRAEGLGVETTGTYQAMYVTANEAGTALQVSYAIMVFSGGCLEDDSAFVGDPTREIVFVKSGGCMRSTPNNDLTAMTLDLDSDDVETTASFVGALDANNEIGVFVIEDGPSSVGLGLLTLVRLDDSARSAFTGATRWVYSYQAPNPVGVNNLGFPGALYFNGPILINGTRDGDVVSGDRIDFDDFGRFLLSLRATNERTTMSGYLAPSLGFGFYYEVDAPDDWVTLVDVTEQPKRAAWGFMVKRP